MQNLQQLIAAGFNRGHDDTPGMDRTVSALEWAFANIGNSGTACCYADDAAGYLEARLIAAYAIQSLAHHRAGDMQKAFQQYQKARAVYDLATDKSSGGALSKQVDAVLSDLGRMFEQKRAAA
ncbi:MAG: hypothetical protein JST44_15140 [Cyanobacteria bacterium SZAS LIN-5]|nr:hypothetical protein [Cyanobacteria bacterium SZAS LIN-5]RTL37752.1 MAG: hypothetical protein EKK48_24010 [Candidatus Melainabacteria bacterium]